MSSKSSLQRLITGTILVGLLGIGAYAINKSLVSTGNQGGAPVSELPTGIPGSSAGDSGTATKTTSIPPLVVETSDGMIHALLRRDGGDDKPLFTDAHDVEKLQQVVGFGTDRAYAVVASDTATSGRLVSISLDGSGKLNLLSSNVAGSGIAVRSDGQRMALVSFDNAERSFGFTLKTMALSGGNEETIETNPGGIALPRWSAGGKLAYLTGQTAPDHGQTVRVRSNGTSSNVFLSAKSQAITDLTWLGDDRIALVLEPLGNNAQNKASVAIVTVSNGQVKKTYDLVGKERSLHGDRTGRFLALISGEVKGAGETAGPVTIINLSTDIEASRGHALGIAGFLE